MASTLKFSFFAFMVLCIAAILISLVPGLTSALSQAVAANPGAQGGVIAKPLPVPKFADVSKHALIKHPEASAIKSCLDNNGPFMTMKAREANVFYSLCEFQKGKWGFVSEIRIRGKAPANLTAFSPGDGSFRSLLDYVNQRAVKFTGILP